LLNFGKINLLPFVSIHAAWSAALNWDIKEEDNIVSYDLIVLWVNKTCPAYRPIYGDFIPVPCETNLPFACYETSETGESPQIQ